MYLSVIQRARAVDEWVRSLLKNEIELICLSIDRIHFHALARFPDRAPRKWLGIAKKESSHYMKHDNLAPVGGLWASRFKCLPITDRQHQLRVVRYILAHKGKGAAVWFQGRRL